MIAPPEMKQHLIARRGTQVPVEDIARVLWGRVERWPESWRNMIAQYAGRLRRAGMNVKTVTITPGDERYLVLR